VRRALSGRRGEEPLKGAAVPGPVRVLQACVRYPPALGGVETHVQRLSEGLVARGHEVTVLTSTLRSEFPFEHLTPQERAKDAQGRAEVVRFHGATLGGDLHWVVLRGLHRWLARHARRYDVVHAHSYGFHHTLATLAAARLLGKPFVLTPHFHPHWSMELGPRRRLLRRAFDAGLKGTLLGGPDAVVCVSRAEGALLGAPRPERVHFIPNGVDPAPFQAARGEAFKQRLGIAGPSALFVGRLASNKGLHTLLDAWQAMPKDATLMIAGEGHLLPQLRERAAREGLGQRVRLLGAVPDEDLRAAYAASDLFVLPSEYEAFGIVLLEAMAAGKPVVATRAGGMVEVVQEGKTGLLVPVGDAPALAGAMQHLLLDRAMAQAMGKAGQGRVHEGFTWDAVTAKVEALYGALQAAPAR
jgi:glycosyltransferase involved in cell wall biosynthesis